MQTTMRTFSTKTLLPEIFLRWTTITFDTIKRINNIKNKQSTSPPTKSEESNPPEQKSTNQYEHITKTTTRHKTTKAVHSQPQLQTTTRFHCVNTKQPKTPHQSALGKQHFPKNRLHQLPSLPAPMLHTWRQTLKLTPQRDQTHRKLSQETCTNGMKYSLCANLAPTT